jgi:hypothetical protein
MTYKILLKNTTTIRTGPFDVLTKFNAHVTPEVTSRTRTLYWMLYPVVTFRRWEFYILTRNDPDLNFIINFFVLTHNYLH